MSTPTDLNDKIAASQDEDEEIIELTEVLEEGPSEVVLELSSLEGGGALSLDDLKSSEPEPAEVAVPEGEESLDNLFDALQDLPENLEAPAAPAAAAAAVPDSSEVAVDEVRQAVLSQVSPEQLQEMVEQVVRETVEGLVRELFPQIAEEVIGREIAALKKTLAEEA